jgi:hypothetical protein
MKFNTLYDWLNEDLRNPGETVAGQSSAAIPGMQVPAGDPSADPQMAQDIQAQNTQSQMQPDQPESDQPEPQNVDAPPSQGEPQDPVAPDMPDEENKSEGNFETWKLEYFKNSVKGDVGLLMDGIHQIRDMELDSYPRKFVEDNLQILFLRQHSNIEKASKEIRKLIRSELDQNNPSVSLSKHLFTVLQPMSELNSVFIKLKGTLGMKGDLHRKYIGALLGAVQVGSGSNNEDLIYNERQYSIKISTRFNEKWGRIDLGKWALREDDPEKFLEEPELKRLEEGSPEEKDVLRRRIVMESIADHFKQRAFLINVVGSDGTVYSVGMDLGSCLINAYSEGKLSVRVIQSDNSEAMIDDDGNLIPFVDLKVKYLYETGEVDENGFPKKGESDFLERIDGLLFLTAQMKTLKEASGSFPGIVIKETPYNGNPSDLLVIQRCVPSASEILMRSC